MEPPYCFKAEVFLPNILGTLKPHNVPAWNIIFGSGVLVNSSYLTWVGSHSEWVDEPPI